MRRLELPQLKLIDDIEDAVRSIRYPTDSAEVFHAQVQLALLNAGLNVTREVMMPAAADAPEIPERWRHNRRVDLVVVRAGLVVALELDRDHIPERTLRKMMDLPETVIRVCILRQSLRAPNVRGVDKVLALRSDMRIVEWTVTGHAILEEVTLVPGRHLQTEAVLLRAAEVGEARRLISGYLKAPRVVKGERKGPLRARRAS